MGFKCKIASCILRLFFWKTKDIHKYVSIPKAVLIMAPHTSAYDFIIGKLVLMKYGVPCSFFIKKEAFNIKIVRRILENMGGIPINRGKINSHVKDAVDILNNNSNRWIIITPEGTRKKVEKWKRGFYLIASQADVPILISYIDYNKKEAAIVEEFYPSGDYETDIKHIRNYYEGVTARHTKYQ